MIYRVINELVEYAYLNLDLKKEDEIYFKNIILGELHLNTFLEVDFDKEFVKTLKTSDYFVEKFTDFLKETHPELTDNEIERKITKIFGIMTQPPSKVIEKFNYLKATQSEKEALDYLFDLSIKNDYVKKSKIDKNKVWSTDYKERNFEVSINLSKPEKSNKDIAKLLVKKPATEEKYPKCLLCKENLGYYGRDDHPARENIRLIPLKLDNETWYLQYSPYGYFNMHCIVLKDTHTNMVINESTFRKLIEFVDTFPYFFVGSNADLPIVGGSILNHEHYQGGEHRLPIMHAKALRYFDIGGNHTSKLSLADWYNTALLIEGEDKEDIVDIATKILTKWREYDDEENNILSHTSETKHNTITPCIKKDGNKYSLYLILRNNRANEEYPDGIFHAHKEYHHIKSEGIGIIEAMGLFVLPARLIRQSNQIKDGVINNMSDEELTQKYPDMVDNFISMYHDIKNEYQTNNDLDLLVREYINKVCRNILVNTAVFKEDEVGTKGLEKFIGGIKF